MEGFYYFIGSIIVSITISKIKNGRKKLIVNDHCCTVSAPGKVLIAGGYLVLEYPNIAITIATTSKFYTTIKLLNKTSNLNLDRKYDLIINIESPQFYSDYAYAYNFDSELVSFSDNRNPFIEKCLSITLAFIKEKLGHEIFKNKLIELNGILGIKLRADNDFYSQINRLLELNLPLLSESLLTLPKFIPCPKDSNNKLIVAKTGMGSSAALTTSLVGGLLVWFNIIDLSKNSDLNIVHNLAQLAHSIAQGKIGSGFDVAAAVYGSQIYKRFSSEKLNECMNPNVNSKRLYHYIIDNSYWTQSIIPFELPPSFDIVLGDVCGGSSSTSMAKQVLEWKDKQLDNSESIWFKLSQSNINISNSMNEIIELAKSSPISYGKLITFASSLLAQQWDDYNKNGIELLIQLRNSFAESRNLLRSLGENAKVDIEPIQQTALVNATLQIPGVICSGVPGAGGQDALYAIVLSNAARKRVERLWSNWHVSEGLKYGTTVCPLTLQALKSNSNGIQIEKLICWE